MKMDQLKLCIGRKNSTKKKTPEEAVLKILHFFLYPSSWRVCEWAEFESSVINPIYRPARHTYIHIIRSSKREKPKI